MLRLWYAVEYLNAFDVTSAVRYGSAHDAIKLGQSPAPPWNDSKACLRISTREAHLYRFLGTLLYWRLT